MPTEITTEQELAAEASSCFETAKRTQSGKTFYKTKDDTPQWVEDMIRDAHGDMLPDDHKYEFVVEALDHISERDNPDEPELEPDIYYHELKDWLSSSNERSVYVDEAVADFGHSKDGIDGDIAMGNLREKEEVYWAVLQAVRDELESMEEEDEEE